MFNKSGSTVLLMVPVLAALIASCTRSSGYVRDRDYYDNSDSFYSEKKPAESPVNPPLPSRALELLQPKKRALVLYFWNDTPVVIDGVGSFAAGELRRELQTDGKLVVPDDLQTRTETKDYVDGDKIKVAQLVREGRRLGVSVIVMGRISKITFRQRREEVGLLRQAEAKVLVEVESKIFEMGTGREVGSYTESGDAFLAGMVTGEQDRTEEKEAKAQLVRDAIGVAIRKMIPAVSKTVDKLSWQGRVAKVLGDKVYLNAGRRSGLILGDILKVQSPGDDIFDPATRAYLGRADGALKGTLEVVDYMGEDTAIAVIHTGGSFLEGDWVRLY